MTKTTTYFRTAFEAAGFWARIFWSRARSISRISLFGSGSSRIRWSNIASALDIDLRLVHALDPGIDGLWSDFHEPGEFLLSDMDLLQNRFEPLSKNRHPSPLPFGKINSPLF